MGRQNSCTGCPAGTYNPSTGAIKKTREEEEEAMTKCVSRNETERGGVEEKRQKETERGGNCENARETRRMILR
jgi:hypothetical protein